MSHAECIAVLLIQQTLSLCLSTLCTLTKSDLVLIQKNGDYEVQASLTAPEVASSNATGLTYYNVEWMRMGL
jgi:hypothetical protein